MVAGGGPNTSNLLIAPKATRIQARGGVSLDPATLDRLPVHARSQTTRQGQHVETNLLSSAVSALANQGSAFVSGNVIPSASVMLTQACSHMNRSLRRMATS